MLSGFLKRLSHVDLPRERSHQHEIGIPKRFRNVFEPELRGKFPVRFVFFSKTAEQGVTGDGYYYNVRQNKADRTPEFRMYYSQAVDEYFAGFRAGDICCFLKDIDHQLYCFVLDQSLALAQSLLKSFADGAFVETLPADVLGQIQAQSEFRVIDLAEYSVSESEQMGTKTKGWYRSKYTSDYLFLYKTPQGETGEHWAEKICFELACLVGIRAASVELCAQGDELGVLSRSFIDRRDPAAQHKSRSFAEFQSAELTHGNQLLQTVLGSAYDPNLRTRKQTLYTLPNIRASLDRIDKELWPALKTYLLFDCWIGNLDRHPENWGILRFRDKPGKGYAPKARYILAPTYDHGPSLASTDTSERRERHMAGDLMAFFLRAKSLVHRQDGRRASFEELITELFAGPDRENQGIRGLGERIKAVTPEDVRNIVGRIPARFMNGVDKEFCTRYLEVSKQVIVKAVHHGDE